MMILDSNKQSGCNQASPVRTYNHKEADLILLYQYIISALFHLHIGHE